MALRNNVKNLEEENNRLSFELQNADDRLDEYSREISVLNESNNKLIKEIESTQNMRVRLRNDIIGVIDQNDQVAPSGSGNF